MAKVIGALLIAAVLASTVTLTLARKAEPVPATTLKIKDGNLYRYWLDGSNTRRHLLVESVDSNPFSLSWSPDGRWVIFLQGLRLYRVPAWGGKPEVMTQTRINGRPSFSPDGLWMFFDVSSAYGWDIYQVRFESDMPSVPITSNWRDDIRAIPSPDGQWLIFMSRRERYNWDIYRLPLGLSDTEVRPQNLTSTREDEYLLGWIGDRIVFDTFEETTEWMTANGGQRELLPEDIARPAATAISPKVQQSWQPAWLLGLCIFFSGGAFLYNEYRKL
jgi:Tol biopolymer transport system component